MWLCWMFLFTGIQLITMNNFDKRPVFLNLTKIRFPVAAVVSIIHRVSGVLLSLTIPVLIYCFALSIKSEQSYSQLLSLLNTLPAKLLLVLLVWLLAHHFFAGIRFLLIDLDIGISKSAASRNSWLVHIAAMSMAAVALGLMV